MRDAWFIGGPLHGRKMPFAWNGYPSRVISPVSSDLTAYRTITEETTSHKWAEYTRHEIRFSNSEPKVFYSTFENITDAFEELLKLALTAKIEEVMR